MKKIGISVVLVLMLIAATFLLTACGAFNVSGEAPTATQLHGRWNVTRTQYRGIFENYSSNDTSSYYIIFNADGSFVERNIWSGHSTGTWTLEGSFLTLVRVGGTGGTGLSGFLFVGDRQVGFEGDTLTMTYTRTEPSTWHYLHTLTRAE